MGVYKVLFPNTAQCPEAESLESEAASLESGAANLGSEAATSDSETPASSKSASHGVQCQDIGCQDMADVKQFRGQRAQIALH